MKQVTTVAVGWIARIAVVVCSLLNTRLLLDLLDVPAYAAYVIVLSLGPWFNLLNLGVPSTTQNTIAKLRSEGKDFSPIQRTAVNAAIAAVLICVALAVPIGWALRQTLLIDYPMASTTAISLMCFGLCVTALGLVFNQVLFALHRGIWPNVMPGVQAITVLMLLLLLKRLGLNGFEWAVAAFVLPATLVFIITAVLAGGFRNFTIDPNLLHRILFDSRTFMLFSVLSIGALSADYMVMAKLLTGSDIVEYNLASKVFSVLLAVHSVVLATSWSLMSDLYFQDAHYKMRQFTGRLLLIGAAVVMAPAICIVAWQNEIFTLIAGSRAVPIAPTLIVTWLVYLLVRVWCDTFAMAHLSCGKLGTMNAYVAVQTLISIAAQCALGPAMGATGILAGITISFLLTAAWILPIKFVSFTRLRYNQ